MTYDTVATVSQVASLLMFIAMFIAVLGYTFWPKNRDKFDNVARAALDLDKNKTIPRGKI